MSVQTFEMPAARGWLQSPVVALTAGLVPGGLVSMAAFLLARYGPVGDGWSFRGNGALAVYALIPAILAGGWTAAVLHYRRQSWIGFGLAAGVLGIGLAVIDAALLPLFGQGADQSVGPIVLVALLAWTAIAPALATRFPRSKQLASRSVASLIAAVLLWAAGLAGGLIVVGLIFPAGS